MRRSTENLNEARLASWAASVDSKRGLAGAACAERRALPAWLVAGDFQSIPISFEKNYEEKH